MIVALDLSRLSYLQSEARMSNVDGCQTIHLCGEVVETMESNGRCVVKVALKSCCLELTADALASVRLGDTIIIDTGIALPVLSIRKNV